MARESDTGSYKIVGQGSDPSHDASKEKHSKIDDERKTVVDDGAFIGNLGWISILSVTIAGLTMGGFGLGL